MNGTARSTRPAMRCNGHAPPNRLMAMAEGAGPAALISVPHVKSLTSDAVARVWPDVVVAGGPGYAPQRDETSYRSSPTRRLSAGRVVHNLSKFVGN